MVAVRFIGGGNQSTQRKTIDLLQVTDNPNVSHNVVSSTPLHEWDSNSQLYW